MSTEHTEMRVKLATIGLTLSDVAEAQAALTDLYIRDNLINLIKAMADAGDLLILLTIAGELAADRMNGR